MGWTFTQLYEQPADRIAQLLELLAIENEVRNGGWQQPDVLH